MVGTDEILALYKQNEKAALKVIFDTYYESLLLFCYKIVRDVESAEDIVHECFVHLWISHRLGHFTGELEPFMFQSVKFRAINHIRNQQRREHLHHEARLEEYSLPVVCEEDESAQELELLYRAVNNLPEACRKIFLMACLDDMKYQEIADNLHISINTVKTQMKIALRLLREKLSKESFSSILLFILND